MADVNATVEPLQGRLAKGLERVTTGMFTALELKKSSPCVSYYQKGDAAISILPAHIQLAKSEFVK